MNLEILKRLGRKQWLIVIGATTLVLCLALGIGMHMSLGKLGPDPGVPGILRREGAADSFYAQISAKEKAIAEKNAIAAKLPERTRLLDSMKSDIEAARKRLPTEAQKGEVRQLIEDLARQVGSGSGALLIKSVSIRETAAGAARGAKSTYKTIEYQTSLIGDMDSLIQFINLIERHDRFMTVDGIQITGGGVETDKENGAVRAKPHTANLRIVTYVDTSGAVVTGARR
jgi:Tfp pilus assembly protein PilO